MCCIFIFNMAIMKKRNETLINWNNTTNDCYHLLLSLLLLISSMPIFFFIIIIASTYYHDYHRPDFFRSSLQIIIAILNFQKFLVISISKLFLFYLLNGESLLIGPGYLSTSLTKWFLVGYMTHPKNTTERKENVRLSSLRLRNELSRIWWRFGVD